jgi:hypothetical protein
MRFIIILLSLIFITYSQPNDTIGYKFDVILDSINKVTDKEHAKEIKTLTTVPIIDSSTWCDKEAVAAEITKYQQQLHDLQQATYELTCNELANYKRSAFNNSMALVSIGAGVVAGIVAISNVRHEKAYKTPTIEITLGVGLIAGGISRFIHQW